MPQINGVEVGPIGYGLMGEHPLSSWDGTGTPG